MIIESGFIVAAGLLLAFFKCPWKIRMKMLSYPLAMDIGIFVVLNMIHWGSFSGTIVAATGALICSGMITVGRYFCGYCIGSVYFSGVFNVIGKLR